jgi:hypothetical protein
MALSTQRLTALYAQSKRTRNCSKRFTDSKGFMEQFLESIQPAQHFGFILSGSFPARLQEAKEARSQERKN